MNDLDYNPTLLIVDDDAGVRALLERLGRRRRAQLMADRDSARRHVLCGMIGRRPRMQELFGLVRRLAPHVRVTLVTGETGTGKELAARALHQLGPRGQRKFITVNCSAVVESLFESELFGHVRGAFTGATEQKQGLFEAADGGTLFLDEVGELPLSLQGKAAANARRQRSAARWLAGASQGRCACHRGDESRSGCGGRGRTVPPRSAVPAECRGRLVAAAAGTPRGHPAADRLTGDGGVRPLR